MFSSRMERLSIDMGWGRTKKRGGLQFSATMPPTQGQKWSIFRTHLSISREWLARSGFHCPQSWHHFGLPSLSHTNTSLE